MKKLLIVVTVVLGLLLLAVGFLYRLYYKYVQEDLHEKKAAQAQVANTFKVAYFDFDTLEAYYDYSKEVRAYLMKKDADNEKILSGMQKKIADKVNEYRSIGASLTQTQQSNYQQEVNELNAQYQQQYNTLGQNMQSEYIQKQQGVKVKIQQYLKIYCKDKGYAYVFGTKEYDDLMYYKDTIRNITTDLLKGLNDIYRSEKKQ